MKQGIRLGSVRPDVTDVLQRISSTEKRVAAVQGGSAITAIPPEAAGGALMLMPLGTPNGAGYNSTTSTTVVELQRLYFTKSASTARYLHYHVTAAAIGASGACKVGCGFVNLSETFAVPSGQTVSRWVCLDMANLPPYQYGTAVYVGGYTTTGELRARIDGAVLLTTPTFPTVGDAPPPPPPDTTMSDTTAPTWTSPGLSAVKVGNNVTVSWTNPATDNIAVTRYLVKILAMVGGVVASPTVSTTAEGTASPIVVDVSSIYTRRPDTTGLRVSVVAFDAMGNVSEGQNVTI